MDVIKESATKCGGAPGSCEFEATLVCEFQNSYMVRPYLNKTKQQRKLKKESSRCLQFSQLVYSCMGCVLPDGYSVDQEGVSCTTALSCPFLTTLMSTPELPVGATSYFPHWTPLVF